MRCAIFSAGPSRIDRELDPIIRASWEDQEPAVEAEVHRIQWHELQKGDLTWRLGLRLRAHAASGSAAVPATAQLDLSAHLRRQCRYTLAKGTGGRRKTGPVVLEMRTSRANRAPLGAIIFADSP
jgi:hypothetical protein